MHQPFYKDPFNNYYRLPWVRLHGCKDYLDMLEILLEFPDIKQVFNFTPSLLEQLIDYTENHAKDQYLEITLKKADELTIEEKVFILENFFLANWDNMIKPFPRYFDLLKKRGFHVIKKDLPRISNYFTKDDYLDLQVLFNLCWIDPLFRNKDSFLKELSEKGRGYSEEEKSLLIEKQFSIIRNIIPGYSSAVKKEQIEISVSPFYHPILPLLCDTDSAKIALPDIKLPRKRFSHPEDAINQVKTGVEYFEKIFGYRPIGMWPSEGSVSEEVLKIISNEGIRWIATDEDILAISLGRQIRDSLRNVTDPELLYKPYQFNNVSIIFRDHIISDLIGFIYSKWDSKHAADDLINKLLHIRNSLPGNKPYLVSIILDGENAWEYYKNDGHDFLRYFYSALSSEKRLKTITPSEYIKNFDAGEPLKKLHAGSWIYANYAVWIGHEEDNTAWDYLTEAREELELFQKMNPDKDLSKAWKAIYIAEGSDWNWWYGDEHTTETQKDFDELFRFNLMKVYQEIGKEIPSHLYIPVLREDRSILPSITIRGFIEPKIDGIVTSYYEWYQAAKLDIKKAGGSMHKSESMLSTMYYGFNKDKLFIRLDPSFPFDEMPDDTRITIYILGKTNIKSVIPLKKDLMGEIFSKKGDDWLKIKDIKDYSIKDIFEFSISFEDLNSKIGDELRLFVLLSRNSEELERCPWRGYISITVPSPDFEAMMWY
ncbi:MAG: glycoside hydrolase family 57 [Nitrospirae bacterium]|jgi:alpha-amylase/alpha-mannosidase (GH57 family)|nr:glycoside hydrolase family 57 [Nitrospirota bacterium]